MELILRFLEKYIIPKSLYRFGQPIYHFLMAFFAALFYGFPSRKMTVIGVTGTKGKTTVCNLIAHILNSAGFKTGMATTVNFRIGDREWQNKTKQTMLGRFGLQKLLAQMAKEGCKYAVIETSSEGILQYRHRFIDYDIAVFTNLTPEHIERHGSFENYRAAKIKLFEKVARKKDGAGVYNLDDSNVEYFLKPAISIKYGYAILRTSDVPRQRRGAPQAANINVDIRTSGIPKLEFLMRDSQSAIRNNIISNIQLYQDKTGFDFNDAHITTPLIGEFNIYNAASAICAALSQNVPMEKIKNALINFKPPAGRMEIIDSGKGFKIVIDYAHEPASLEAVYKAIANLHKLGANDANGGGIRVIDGVISDNSRRMICLLGAQGGGRDKWKRPKMGEIAARYCDEIILTNEDPYDENPLAILENIARGFSQIPNSKFQIPNCYKILDRREAIKKAFSLAKTGDIVILTGKGGESWMCVENGKKIPWDERKLIEQFLNLK